MFYKDKMKKLDKELKLIHSDLLLDYFFKDLRKLFYDCVNSIE